MKKIVFSFVFILTAISVFSQDFEPIFTLGLNTGIDQNINALQIQPNLRYNYQYFALPTQYNVGLDFAVAVTKKLRPRLEFRYVNSQYLVRWNTPMNEGYDMIKSIQNVNNFDINFHLDYLWFSVKKLDVYVSPGLKYEYVIGNYLHTFLTDGPSTSTNWNILTPVFPRDIGAGVVSMIFKYNIAKHVGFTLTPEYTLFWRDYVSGNNALYQRLSLNAGFEFRF